jgi:gluconolactonase
MARRCAWIFMLLPAASGCLASPGQMFEPLGLDGEVRDARGLRDSGHRDIGLWANLDAEELPDNGDLDGGLPTYTWYQHVEPIVVAKCQRCHGDPPAENAPYSIVTYAQTQAQAPALTVPVYERMSLRVQSPDAPMPPRMPPHPFPPPPEPLTVDEIEIIRIWALIGAPAGMPDAGIPDSGIDAGIDSGEPPDLGEPDTGIVSDAGGMDPLTGIAAPTTITTPPLMLAEGPAWQETEQLLYFSDLQGNVIYTLAPPNTVTVFRMMANRPNGLGFDNNGALVACEHETRRVSRTQQNGMTIPFAAEYNMLPLNSPNDLVVRSDFNLYFTDPPYGLADPMLSEQGVNGLYRRSLINGLTVRDYDFDLLTERPNGLAFSPDENTLYVADTMNNIVYTFDVDPTGVASNRMPFITAGIVAPDGLCTDVDGNLYVAAQNGVYVFQPDGDMWGNIPVAGAVTNCAFGGATRTTLFITGRNALLSVEMNIPGGQ